MIRSLLLFNYFNLCDIVLTFIAATNFGNREINSAMKSFIGLGFIEFFTVKIVLALVVSCYFYFLKRGASVILANYVFSFVVFWDILVILSLRGV